MSAKFKFIYTREVLEGRVEVREGEFILNKMNTIREYDADGEFDLHIKPHWHETKVSAIKRVEVLYDARIKWQLKVLDRIMIKKEKMIQKVKDLEL